MRLAISELARALSSVVRTKGDLVTAVHMDALKPYLKAAALIRAAIETGVLSADATTFGDLLASAPSRSVIAAVDAVSPWRRSTPGIPVLVNGSKLQATWRKEGQQIDVVNGAFSTVRLSAEHILAGILVFTAEAAKEIGETFVRQLSDDIASAINGGEGEAMFDVANTGTANAPASITSGGIVVASTGSTGDDLRADLSKLLDDYRGDTTRSVWVASAGTAARLALAGDSLGDADATTSGGYLAGLPLIAATGVPDAQISIIDPSAVVVYDGGVSFSVSKDALLFFAKTEGGDAEAVSTFQENYIGMRYVRVLDWQAPRAGDSVATLTGIDWTPPTP